MGARGAVCIASARAECHAVAHHQLRFPPVEPSRGPGGHFAVCGIVRLLGAIILRTTPDKQLFLDEEQQGDRSSENEVEERVTSNEIGPDGFEMPVQPSA